MTDGFKSSASLDSDGSNTEGGDDDGNGNGNGNGGGDGPLPPSPGQLNAVVTAPTTTCVSPCLVFFDGSASTRTGFDENQTLLDLEYSWDFGDPLSGTWNEGARGQTPNPESKNTDHGFVAAHLYEPQSDGAVSAFPDDCNGVSCKKMTATLTLREGEYSDSAQIEVQILNPDVEWAADKTICISSSTTPVAGSAGCPSGAQVFNDSDFNRALEEKCNVDSSPVRCLFRGGDSFSAGRTTVLRNSNPSLIGSYGTEKATVAMTSGSTSSLLRIDQIDAATPNNGLRIVDLNLIGNLTVATFGISIVQGSPAEANSGHAIHRFLSLRLNIEDFGGGYQLRGNSYAAFHPRDHMHSEIGIIDGTVLHSAGKGDNDAFVMGHYFAIMGSRLADKRRGTFEGEHIFRAKYLNKAVIAHNSFGLYDDTRGAADANYPAGVPLYDGCNPDGASSQGNTILKIIAGFSNDMPAGQESLGHSQKIMIADNLISACRNNSWNIGVGPTDTGAEKAAEHVKQFILERNHFVSTYNLPFRMNSTGDLYALDGGSAQYIHISNASHFAVRNNVLDATSIGANIMSMTGIQIQTNAEQRDLAIYSPVTGGRILNNTFYQAAAQTERRTMLSLSDANVTNMRVSNNLMYSAGTGSETQLFQNLGLNTQCCGGSTCPGSCNQRVSTLPFLITPSFPSTRDEFQLSDPNSPIGARCAD